MKERIKSIVNLFLAFIVFIVWTLSFFLWRNDALSVNGWSDLKYFTVDGRTYVKVHVDRLPKPDVAYVYERDVFRRFNATTRILNGKERDRFMMGRMKRNKANEEEEEE